MKLFRFILSFFRKEKKWNTMTISCSLDDPAGNVDVRYERGPVDK
jgi:hypothetical protein